MDMKIMCVKQLCAVCHYRQESDAKRDATRDAEYRLALCKYQGSKMNNA